MHVLQPKVPKVDAVEADRARRRIVKARDEVEQRRLSGAGWTGDAEGLAGAVVEARVGEQSQAQTVSDASGRYRLRLAPGRYTFAFRLIGYAERRVPDVTVSEGNAAISVDAELTPVAVQLEHTVVTGTAPRAWR